MRFSAMKNVVYALAVLAFAVPALAQSNPPAPTGEKISYVCWYDANGKLTGAQAVGQAPATNKFIVTGRGGDRTWAYILKSTDGRDCPDHARN
jgi:hypothetical protein